jgi:hypothetical protein
MFESKTVKVFVLGTGMQRILHFFKAENPAGYPGRPDTVTGGIFCSKQSLVKNERNEKSQ